jgi:hypothetical protein
MQGTPRLQATYILPLKRSRGEAPAELAAYINTIRAAQVIVADASGDDAFADLHTYLEPHVSHVRTDPDISGRNGKVRNVLTALRRARHDRIVIGDDDVRYDERSLRAVVAALDCADVVRPQNYFDPLPWHALLDTGRTLINRALDGDWPGTLAFRRASLPHGYNADVLFENYELVRTIKTRGGRELVLRTLYVLRRPPSTAHFVSQRVRQAYDEFARPVRLVAALAILPIITLSLATRVWAVPIVVLAFVLALAAFGRLRDNGKRYFPALAVAAAPLWVLERAVCAWLALYQRFRYGGVRYAGGILRDATTPRKDLQRWAV